MAQKYAISLRMLSKVFISINVQDNLFFKTIKSACPFNLTDSIIPIVIKIVRNLVQTKSSRVMSNM